MKQQLEQRLKELKTEFESGQKALVDLENRQADLRNTLMRISGAIQVLEEELTKESDPELDDIGQFEVIPEPEPINE
ncbi:MAG: hypothetical protein E4H43_00210 [Bacteroidia bacterium]|nr:MAG: hypothetical protein E4H43_00210 [Bacteroidia bacterium]